jgi:hypothetical protein
MEVSGAGREVLKRLWNKYGDPGDVAFEAKAGSVSVSGIQVDELNSFSIIVKSPNSHRSHAPNSADAVLAIAQNRLYQRKRSSQSKGRNREKVTRSNKGRGSPISRPHARSAYSDRSREAGELQFQSKAPVCIVPDRLDRICTDAVIVIGEGICPDSAIY